VEPNAEEVQLSQILPSLMGVFYNPAHCLGDISSVENLTWQRNAGNFISRTDLQMVSKFRHLIQFFEKSLSVYLAKLGIKYERLEIPICWANKTPPGGSHHRHFHPYSSLSAIYYLNDAGGATRFLCPPATSFYMPVFRSSNEYNYQIITIETEPGALVVFPSSMHHEVTVNSTETNRYTLSFNVILRGEMGGGHGGDCLVL
jgi:uncharacterized protein (TIGR02466 family)